MIFKYENDKNNSSKLSKKPNKIELVQENQPSINRPTHPDSLKKYLFDSLFTTWQIHHIFNGNVLIVKGNKMVFEGSFGFKNCDKNDTLSKQSAFQLASVSKQFTAAAIMQCIEKGKIKLTDSLGKYIPSLPFDSTITIHHLLSHSSGLPNYVPILDSLKEKEEKIDYYNHQTLVENLIKVKPKMLFKPGTAFQYNNTNYAFLAIIVEKVSGMKFGEYLTKNIFKPAKMTSSFCYDPKNKLPKQKIIYGHSDAGEVLFPNHLDGILGDKGVYTTYEDLLKWQKALFGYKIVNKTSLGLMTSPKHDFENTKNRNYGYGFRLKPWGNQKWVPYHTGWWHGYKTFFWINPVDKTTVILLGNRASYFLKKSTEVLDILYFNKPNNQYNDQSDED